MAQTNKLGSSAVRDYARRTYVDEARHRALRRFSINAGTVHKALHLENRVPLVCQALQSTKFLEENGLRIVDKSGPPSGQSTSVTLTYEFVDETRQQSAEHSLLVLRGLLRDVFRELGGGENFIRSERQAFSSAVDREGTER